MDLHLNDALFSAYLAAYHRDPLLAARLRPFQPVPEAHLPPRSDGWLPPDGTGLPPLAAPRCLARLPLWRSRWSTAPTTGCVPDCC